MYKARASDGSWVAVKTFRKTASPDGQACEGLHRRFHKEVMMFKQLGLEPGTVHVTAYERNPKHFFVNLLDFSKDGGGMPGPADDKKFYTILELGDENLDIWLRTTKLLRMPDFCKIARSLLAGLEFLHGLGFVHLDVKPENLMRFGSRWKLIDLAGCLSVDDVVPSDSCTPLYTSPEFAKVILSEIQPGHKHNIRACPSMDLWAAGASRLEMPSRRRCPKKNPNCECFQAMSRSPA